MPDNVENLSAIAFEYAPIGVVLTEERIIKSCNRVFAEMFGYEVDELIGQSFRVLYNSHTEFEHIRDVGVDALKNTGKYSDERLMPRRDGTMFWCRVRAHTFHPDAPLKRAILSFADISDARPAIALTLREREVLQCIARGMTAKEAGRHLSISPRTVEEHRAKLLTKFEVKNSVELLARLTGYGL